jgi:hypothetical protein
VGLVGVSLATAQWYRSRSPRIGLKMHQWPGAVVTVALLVIAWMKSDPSNFFPPFLVSSHLWSAGAIPLWFVVVGVWILVVQERSFGAGLFATGFSALVLAVSVAPAAGFMRWDGRGAAVTYSNYGMYTVLLPGAYLALGALVALARREDQRRRLRLEDHVNV